MLACTNKAASKVQILPLLRLARLKMRLCCAKTGSCCHAQKLTTMHARINVKVVFKESAPERAGPNRFAYFSFFDVAAQCAPSTLIDALK
jgi:hypothetical protein